MTPEQIDLEFEHIAIDRQASEGNKQVYIDDEYEKYDEDSEEFDNKLSDMPVFSSDIDPNHIEKAHIERQQKEDDWVDVETDDY